MSKIHAEDNKTIKDLLESDTLVFKIPINQRKYSWGIDQLDAFWSDFELVLEKNNTHYLGVISLIVKNEDEVSFKSYEVIDGQQRLTTVILLLAALRDIYISMKDVEKAKKIQEKYLSVSSTRIIKNKLSVSKLDMYTFNELVNINVGEGTDIKLKDSYELKSKKNCCRKVDIKSDKFINEKMYYAYNYFYNKIVMNMNEFSNIKDKKDYLLDLEDLLSRLDIILITSEDIESMFLFFESLNNRGLQLSKIDIVRNILLKIVSEKFATYLDDFGEMWDRLTANLEEYDEIKFLKYYFMCSPENKIIQEKDLPKYYTEYFNSFDDRNDLKDEIEKMIEYSKIYQRLFDKQEASINDDDYIINIKMINQVGQQACHSFLMDYLYNVKDKNRLSYITKKIEKMMFRRIVAVKSNKQLDGIFRSMIKSRQLNSENMRYEYTDGKLIKIINEKTPSDIEFKRMLNDKKWEKDEITNYFFRKIEATISNDNIRSKKECHVEHIIPINYETPWVEKLNFDREQDRAKYDLLVNKLGNVIILESELKSEEKDSAFVDKLVIYKKSKFEVVKKFVGYNNRDWLESDIDNRTKELVEFALKVWKL